MDPAGLESARFGPLGKLGWWREVGAISALGTRPTAIATFAPACGATISRTVAARTASIAAGTFAARATRAVATRPVATRAVATRPVATRAIVAVTARALPALALRELLGHFLERLAAGDQLDLAALGGPSLWIEDRHDRDAFEFYLGIGAVHPAHLGSAG